MRHLRWKQTVAAGEAFHIARVQLRGANACPVHDHDFAEVFWVERGAGNHRINGQRLPLKRGTIIAIRPADSHGFTADTADGLTLVNVAFPAATVRFLRERYFRGQRDFLWSNTTLPRQLTLTASRLRWLEGWTEHLARAPRTRLEIERFLIELLSELIAQMPHATTELPPEWLTQALERIREPQHFVHGTRELARLAGRTPQHVNRELKDRLRLTATDVVNRARLDQAGLLLRMTPKKIIEIALDCGFENLAYFYQLFRAHYGVTPRLYRRRHQAVFH